MNNDVVKMRREAVDLGYIGPTGKVRDYLSRIERLKILAKDENDPGGFVAINTIRSLEYLKDNIPKKWKEMVVRFLAWRKERQQKSTR